MDRRSRQRGLSAIGFLFVAVVVIAAALAAVRVIPSYVEWYTVRKAVVSALRDVPDGSPAAVRKAFETRIETDYVDSVNWQDLVVSKDGNDIVGSISWQKRLPLFYNISLLLDFDVNETR
jgi:Tfp pilus assembly major pilin PilA